MLYSIVSGGEPFDTALTEMVQSSITSKGAEKMAFDKASYDREFHKERYDRVEFTVLKGKRDELKALAKSEGVPVSELIALAIWKQYGLNLLK